MSRYFWLRTMVIAGLVTHSATAEVEVAVEPDAKVEWQCSFPLSAGDQSIQRFTLTADVYQCMRHINHRDLVVVNSQGEPVPSRITALAAPHQRETYTRPLPFYTEPSPPAYGTREQIRRITQLCPA